MARQPSLPTVLLVGRTNVGKTTLWNTMIGEEKGIVSPLPHTTRDVAQGEVSWRGVPMRLLDSGGWNLPVRQAGLDDTEVIAQAVVRAWTRAIKSSQLVLLVVDARTGIMPQDRALATVLKRARLPTYLVANKVDSPRDRPASTEFLQLGIPDLFPVSAITGSGVGDLLDAMVRKLGAGHPPPALTPSTSLKIAIVGKTNVGKSSLANSLLGTERVIVAPTPHTTREPQDTQFAYQGNAYLLIDTVGLRKKALGLDPVEAGGDQRTRKAITRSDIVLFVLDVSSPITTVDAKIAGELEREEKPLMIVANKWDLVKNKTPQTTTAYAKTLRANFPALAFAPILFVSAKTDARVRKIFHLVERIQAERAKVIPEQELEALTHHLNPPTGEARARVASLVQMGTNPPTFALSVRSKTRQPLPYAFYKFIENRLRERYGFVGTPIKIILQKS